MRALLPPAARPLLICRPAFSLPHALCKQNRSPMLTLTHRPLSFVFVTRTGAAVPGAPARLEPVAGQRRVLARALSRGEHFASTLRVGLCGQSVCVLRCVAAFVCLRSLRAWLHAHSTSFGCCDGIGLLHVLSVVSEPVTCLACPRAAQVVSLSWVFSRPLLVFAMVMLGGAIFAVVSKM